MRALSSRLAWFNQLAQHSANACIKTYSSSFFLAARMLPRRQREQIAAIYAMVRIADEIVDGAGSEAGKTPAEIEQLLDDFARQVQAAVTEKFHPNPVCQAFGKTARELNLKNEWLTAFFAAMRQDIRPVAHTKESLATYIYGSAEVVGLMCLAVFAPQHLNNQTVCAGAQALGAAFQRINFLRDEHEDLRLGRNYLGFSQPSVQLAQAKQELAQAAAVLSFLPLRPRIAVAASMLFYQEVLLRVDPTGKDAARVSVPPVRKLQLLATAILHRGKVAPMFAPPW